METISYTYARQHLAQTIKDCVDNCEHVVIRSRERAVALIPLDEYRSIMETLHLLRSPANARRLYASLKAADAGKLTQIKLADI